MKTHLLLYVGWLVCAVFGKAVAQDPGTVSTDYLHQLILDDSLQQARNLYAKNIDYYFKAEEYDSLLNHIEIAGSIKLNHGDVDAALQSAEKLTLRLKDSDDPEIIKLAFQELSWLHSEFGRSKSAYHWNLEAAAYAEKMEDPVKSQMHLVEYNLGVNAFDFGDFQLAKSHLNRALYLLLKYDKDNYESLQATYNSLGRAMWMKAETDSAGRYFESALDALSRADSSDLLNRYFRPGLIYSNLAVLNGMEGDYQKAIALTETSVEVLGKYIKLVGNESRIRQAMLQQLVSLDNLASYYNTTGEFKRSLDLFEYSLGKKKKLLEEDDPNVIISWILVAQIRLNSLDLRGAEQAAEEALRLLNMKSDKNLYWEGSALMTRASVYDQMKQYEVATLFFEDAEAVYRKVMKGEYPKSFMDDLIQMSLFYARRGQTQKAKSLAKEIYDFGKKSDFRNTLQDLHHIINRAEVCFLLNDYEKAARYSKEAISFRPDERSGIMARQDSVAFLFRKPKALLFHARSQYHLHPPRSRSDFETLIAEVESALEILDMRKKTLTAHEDISLFMVENAGLYDFAKKLLVELYDLTGDKSVLDRLAEIIESGVYTRIRSHLYTRENMRFSELPEEVTLREQSLTSALAEVLDDDGKSVLDYMELNQQWKTYLDSLKQFYPRYYQMKFGTPKYSASEIQNRIPGHSTVIRYFFADEQLYAFVLTAYEKTLIRLNYSREEDRIDRVRARGFDSEEVGKAMYELYQTLWQPLEHLVRTEKIIIIPDEELYNLSFEMLSFSPWNSFYDFAENCLLSRHVISYHYSLYNIFKKTEEKDYQTDFIAFVPGFSREMKDQYQLQITDSAVMDRSYLTLLPQPFSEDVSVRFSKFFKGMTFLRNQATKESFVRSAGGHKIIHIGTHAESDNLNPGSSRLYFAKDQNRSFDDNFLYVHEIYNTNLQSALTVLTACETGKPVHQPGEGMISLAHAFNYAGSESILTCLWKVDEESSARIVAYFYENLSGGMDKDRALREAKLKYLSEAKGRALAPEYWAGIFLMGDSDAVSLTSFAGPSSWTKALWAIVLLAGFVWFLGMKSRVWKRLPLL